MLGLPFFKSTHVFFACGSVHVSIWTVFRLEILARINFLFLVSSQACRDAPQSRCRCEEPNKCLPNFLKMLFFALFQISTNVLYLWKSISLDSVWIGDSRPYQLSFFSYVLARLICATLTVFVSRFQTMLTKLF